MYHGVQKETDPGKLINFDIVLTTYSTIRTELFPKRNSQARKSPLSDIVWYRIVLDEGKK